MVGADPLVGVPSARDASSRIRNNDTSTLHGVSRPTGASAANQGVRPTKQVRLSVAGKVCGIRLRVCATRVAEKLFSSGCRFFQNEIHHALVVGEIPRATDGVATDEQPRPEELLMIGVHYGSVPVAVEVAFEARHV